jgi:SAM-dependent methyltransferase
VSTGGQPVHLVDVAAGPGRYVLDLLRRLPPGRVTALLRDRDPRNLAAGRRLAAGLGLRGVTYAQGDAFDEADLARLAPAPTIAVVSGLYELVPDNGTALRSLRGLYAALRPGGYLVYTNQPWHPQLELIARVLCTCEGRPWVMRRRTQAEMDALVRQAGFAKVASEVDEDGIFSVSLGVRR